jgi:hypothetical protein
MTKAEQLYLEKVAVSTGWIAERLRGQAQMLDNLVPGSPKAVEKAEKTFRQVGRLNNKYRVPFYTRGDGLALNTKNLAEAVDRAAGKL